MREKRKGEKKSDLEMCTDWWCSVGKVSWQPAGRHGDGMTVRQSGKHGCWLPMRGRGLGEETKNLSAAWQTGSYLVELVFYLESKRQGAYEAGRDVTIGTKREKTSDGGVRGVGVF